MRGGCDTWVCKAIPALFAALLWIGSVPAIVAAADDPRTIRIHTESWPGYTNSDGSGFAWDVIRAVYEPLNIGLSIKTMPYARATMHVVHGEADAWVGSYKDEVSEAVYPEWHYDADRVEALFRHDRGQAWQGLPSLRNQRVAWIRGYRMDRYFEVPVKSVPLSERKSALRMMEAGRLDFFLDASSELDDMLADLPDGLARSTFRRQHLMNLRLYLGFAPTDRGRRLARIWDERFPRLLESGRVAEIYNEYDFVVWPFEVPRKAGSESGGRDSTS